MHFTFTVEPHHLQFRCDWAVYPRNGGTSLCYCINKATATLIATSLTAFIRTPVGLAHFTKEPIKKKDLNRFIPAKHMLQFECYSAVFSQFKSSSVCYSPIPDFSNIVAAALNYYLNTTAGKVLYKKLLKANRKNTTVEMKYQRLDDR